MLWQQNQLKFFQHKPVAVDRKALSGSAVSVTDELKSSNSTSTQEINLRFNADTFATWATSVSEANANLASDDSRRKFFCGDSISYFFRDDDYCLFVKLVDNNTQDEKFVDRELYENRGVC